LPTILILSFTLLIIALSTFQAGASLSRSLQDGHWNRLAKEAAQAGSAYAAACAKEVDTGWTNPLTPTTDCLGASNGSSDNFYDSDMTTADSPRWQATYSISRVEKSDKIFTSTQSDNVRTATVTGIVKVFSKSDSSNPRRTYTSKMTAFINQDDVSYKNFSNMQSNADRTCILKKKDDTATPFNESNQLYCTVGHTSSILPYGKMTRFPLPSGEVVKDWRYIYDTKDLHVVSLCVLSSAAKMYCAGANAYGEFGIGGGFTFGTQDTNTKGFVPFDANKIKPFAINDGTPDGSPVLVKEMWLGANVYGNICVLGIDNFVYCAGGNFAGAFGNGGHTNIQNNSTKFSGSNFFAVKSFNTAAFDPSLSSPVRVKHVYGHYIIPANEPQGLFGLDQDFVTVNNRRCVMGSNDQVYCSGACTSFMGGLLFGSARYGSGTKGCGSQTTLAVAYSPNQSPSLHAPSASSDPCYGSYDRNTASETGVTDNLTDCYYNPVQVMLPKGLKARQVRITNNASFYAASTSNITFEGYQAKDSLFTSSLCIYASNAKTYCTLSHSKHNFEFTEPVDMSQLPLCTPMPYYGTSAPSSWQNIKARSDCP
jgi:hypothetical protein